MCIVEPFTERTLKKDHVRHDIDELGLGHVGSDGPRTTMYIFGYISSNIRGNISIGKRNL